MKALKTAAALLLAALTLLALSGCSGDETSDALTVMGRKSDMEKSYMTEIFRLYESETGNKLRIIEYEDSEYELKASEMFAKGEVPDVFMHFNNADLKRFNAAENFLYLNGESWTSDLTDSAAAYCEDPDGNLLGLPFWESSISGCYYNKTLLDSLGLRPAATQAEFDVLCETLAEIGYTPICWPADGCTWMYQFGLDPIFADDGELLEKINANEVSYSEIPAVKDMAEWIAGAAKKGWFGQKYAETGWDGIGEQLGSGEAVMTFIWDTWFYTDFQGGKYTVDDFALMPVFMNTCAGGTYEGGNLNMMMVNKNSEKLDEALNFLAFCAFPEHYNAAFKGISTVSCFKGQTTNIQSDMVTEAAASIKAKERVSTAATRIIGYSAEDVAEAFNSLLSGGTDAEGCVKIMDEKRIEEAKSQGIEGFTD